MFSPQRQAEILRIVRAQQTCTITDLAGIFTVSDETIRRDIKPLIADGVLLKVHGGVMLPERLDEPPFQRRMQENLAAKQVIAARVGEVFKRVFFGEEDHIELYSSIMKGVGERHRTPFFHALRDYAKQPTGVFHALPLARGKSIMNSNWIGDLAQFYGMNLFMAETSATSGGLDSLLDPVGPLKLAQEYASRAFGARQRRTRGIAEITRLAVACGGRRETMAGLAGLGDLVLTCTGELSRNRRVGFELGKGRRLSDILNSMGGKVAEGVLTTRAALGLATTHGIEMPITTQVDAILHRGKSPREAVAELMRRPGRDEL